ncbi:hypothetical protein BGX38DRAFT_1265157 [Terfezia claveryi]|nr:hypothetical protein BGX38DRAFT_1265157 [Terfezia claveryi]
MSGTPGPAIQPLRIHKHSSSQDFDANPSNSPQPPRPLSELGSLAGRRNSVQYKVARRFGEDMAALGGSTRASPRAFWLENLPENAKVKDSPTPSPRRTSLENLKKASRVQNKLLLLKQQLHSPSPPPVSGRPMSMPPQTSGSPLKLESTPLKSSLTSPKKTDPNSPPRTQTTPPKNATLTSIMRGDNTTQIRASGRGKSSLLASYKVNGRSDIEEGTDGEDSTNTSPNRRKAVTFDDVPAQVVEYELITPVPSVDGSPSMSYDSHDSDDDDEYDYDNTPVIEPDHWKDMPERVATPPRLGDPFRASPSPTGRPLPPLPGTPLSRSDSTSSNRPLPSIPFKSQIQSQQQISLHEKMQMMMQKSNAELHPDPNAHVEEERAYGAALGISFEELALNEGRDEETDDDDRTMSPELILKETTLDNYEAGSGPYSKSMQFDKEFDFKRPKKISRDSIRRHVTRRDGSTSSVGSNESRETLSTVCDGNEEEQSRIDGPRTIDMSIVPLYDSARPNSRYATRTPDAESEIIASEGSEYASGDNDSKYSETGDSDSDATPTAGTPRAISPIATATSLPDPTENVPILSAPVPASPPTPPKEDEVTEKRLSLSLPEFTVDSNTDGLGLMAFMTPSPPPVIAPSAAAEPTPVPSPEPMPVLTTTPVLLPHNSPKEQRFDRPSTPENQHIEIDEDLERTPESVIRHKVYHSDQDSEYDDEPYEGTEDGEDEPAQAESEADSSSRAETPQIVEPRRSPSPIPDNAATIRAPGGKLRTRPSATPADMAAMAAQRRQVSGDHTNAARMAAEAGSSDEEGSEEEEEDEEEDEEEEEEGEEEEEDSREGTASDLADPKGKTPMRKISRKSLRMPTLDELNIDLNLEEEFDRVIETQKRGYLMRHSTRVIHASSRDIDEEPTARAQGHKRTQSWQVEPWKGSGRRRSTRNSLGQTGGQQDVTAPPMPGQTNPTSALHLAPPTTTAGIEGQKPPTPPENGERGRLFVKVIGVKDLTLPMPQREPTWFCLTLDNGLHCVTTSWLELAKNAPIGQEFELVVLNDLEFQLTLQTKLEKPPPKAIATPPTPLPQPQKMPKPKSTFSRVFISPKKRKELERQQREQQQLMQQQQQQAQAQAQAQKTQPEEPLSAWELLNGLVARDGSFARSYVCLKDFEQKAYGRPFIAEINCFNEWAIEPGSLKTKRGNNPVRRPPYRIGKLEVQMLFVPKPPGMTDKDLPKSMAAAIRELKEAENMVARSWEGYLSQQGGDCPFWRRRYFKLIGAKLTAYHEVNRQPRATINLAKAIRLIDDRPSLTEPEIPTTNGKRRKSAFAEMEEGYMFVEEGFRIKFQNGETIDFYADNAEDKQGWMNVLGETIGGGQENRNWCELILNKEKMDREQASATQQRRMQQQQVQMQQFEKSYMPSTPGRNEHTSSRTDLGDDRPSPPPKPTKRPVSGVPAGYPQGSIGSVNSTISLGRSAILSTSLDYHI